MVHLQQTTLPNVQHPVQIWLYDINAVITWLYTNLGIDLVVIPIVFRKGKTKVKKVWYGGGYGWSESRRSLHKSAWSELTISTRTQLACKKICDFTEILFCKVAIRIANQVLSIPDDPIVAPLSLSPFLSYACFSPSSCVLWLIHPGIAQPSFTFASCNVLFYIRLETYPCTEFSNDLLRLLSYHKNTLFTLTHLYKNTCRSSNISYDTCFRHIHSDHDAAKIN